MQEHGTPLLAAQPGRQHHAIGHEKLAQLLHQQNYSLQGTRMSAEGADHPDRDARFRNINASVQKTLAAGIPVLSSDAKKKDLLCNYANARRQWRPVRQAPKVQGHDLPRREVPIRTGSTTLDAMRAL